MAMGVVIGVFILSFYLSYQKSMDTSINKNINENLYKAFMLVNVQDDKEIIENLNEISKNNGTILTYTSKEKEIIFEKVYILSTKYDYFKDIYTMLGKNQVVIGKALAELSYNENGKELIKIKDKVYEVKGVLNENNMAYKMFLGKDNFKEDILNTKISRFTIYLVEKNISNAYLETIFTKEAFERIWIKTSEDSYNLLADEGFYIILVIFIISFTNICNFSLLWISKRKHEIALYKALGAKNINILNIIFLDMLKITFIAMAITLVLQNIIMQVINNAKILNFYMSMDYMNIIICTLLVIGMSFLSVIPSFLNTIKIDPAIILKEE